MPLFLLLLSTLFVPAISSALELNTWNDRSSSATQDLNAIAYGNGIFVAVGDAPYPRTGTPATILTSSDNGNTWTQTTSGVPNDVDLYGITYGSKFVAVGSSGTILTSTDGLSWSPETSNTTKNLLAVTYNGSNLYVAVGSNGYVSGGGVRPAVQTWPGSGTWTSQTSGVTSAAYGYNLNGIAYGNGKFVAVSDDSEFLTSTNGTSWSAIYTNVSGVFHGITYNGSNKFVAVGQESDTVSRIVTSSDGSSWTISQDCSSGCKPWTKSLYGSSRTLYGVTYGNGTYIVVGSSGTIMSSTDGITWTSRTSGITTTLSGIAYGNPAGSKTFVAAGWLSSGAPKILQSDNLTQYTVTGSAGANGNIVGDTGSTNRVGIYHGGTTTFTITPAANYHGASLSDNCGAGGSLDKAISACTNSSPCMYTTGQITGACSVSVTFTIDQDAVSTSITGSGSVDPTSATVDYNTTKAFTLTAGDGYHIGSVTDNCKSDSTQSTGAQLSGSTYTTGPIQRNNCTVSITFTINNYTVSTAAGAHGTIEAGTTANHDQTKSFIVTPDTGYHIASVTDNCGTGSTQSTGAALNTSTYTTGPIKGNCTVTASFAIDTHTVETHVAGSGGISPTVTVEHGAVTNFTVTPSANYHLVSVTDTCSTHGNLTPADVAQCTNANPCTYSFGAGAITSDCSVTATFTIDTYDITPTTVGIPPNGTISPDETTPVNHGASQTFNFTPGGGYHVTAVVIRDGSGNVIDSRGANTASYEFTNVTAIRHISVEFEQNEAVQYTLVTPAATGGTVSCVGPVNSGSSSLCTITPAANFHLQRLLDNSLSKEWTSGGTAGTFEYTASNITTSDRQIVATFELYITATAGTGGTVDAEGITAGQVSLASGGSKQFSITPSTGYHIESVTLDSAAIPLTSWNIYASNPYTVDVGTTNRAIAATFAKNTYTITPSTTSGGSISPAGVQSVEYGANLTFNFLAEEGNKVSKVEVNGSEVTKGNSWPFINVTSNQTLKVTFELYTYVLTVNAGSGGKIEASGPLTANWNESRTFTITPNTGYHIEDVKLDGESIKSQLSSTNTYVLSNIKAIHTIAATFAIDTFTITPGTDSNGSISPSVAETVNYGTTKIYTITPKDGYHILDVKIDGTSVSVTDGTYTFASIDKDHTIAVTFSINTYSIIASAGSNGTISSAGTTIVENGTSKTFTITPGEIYHVADVKVDGTSVGAVTSYQFTNITANHTIDATFEINSGTYTISVTRSGRGNGIVTSSTGGINCGVTCNKTFNADTQVILTAVQDSGSEFGGWIGGGCTGTGSCTVNKNEDATVNAVFNVPGEVALTLSKLGTGEGDIKRSPATAGVTCGSDCVAYIVNEKKPQSVKLTAIAKSNSKFLGWSGDCAAANKKTTCSVTMLSAKAAIANFELKVPNVYAPSSVSFGTAKVVKNKVKAVTKVLKITNKGDGNLTISNLEITGDTTDFSLILSSSIKTVKPKASLIVKVKFNPTSAGAKSAELQISSNDPNKPLVKVALSGTRTAISAKKSSSMNSDSNFYPEDPVTREEAAAFVIRAAEGEPEDNYCLEKSPFTDVSSDAWSCKYIKRMNELGLINGCLSDNIVTPENEAAFCPGAVMTREQIAALIIKTIDGEPNGTTCETGSPYSDITSDRWSCRYIKRFNELGIDSGYSAHNLFSLEERFYPEDPATREETAIYLIRAIEGEPPSDYCNSGSPFDDVTNDKSCRYIKRLYEIWTSPRTSR